MANENPTWGAPRIHGEMLKLGFEISERTVSRYLARLHSDRAANSWRTFLKNHREVIGGMDFFTVITANFRILYCFFLIHHIRREIIHLNVTEHPTGEWVVQQTSPSFPREHGRPIRDLRFETPSSAPRWGVGFWTQPAFLPSAPATEKVYSDGATMEGGFFQVNAGRVKHYSGVVFHEHITGSGVIISER